MTSPTDNSKSWYFVLAFFRDRFGTKEEFRAVISFVEYVLAVRQDIACEFYASTSLCYLVISLSPSWSKRKDRLRVRPNTKDSAIFELFEGHKQIAQETISLPASLDDAIELVLRVKCT